MTGSEPVLGVVADWFTTTAVDDGLTLVEEPHVGELLRANSWHVRGRDRDVLIDCGLGVASMRDLVVGFAGREPVVVLTHAHLDHMGSAHEFAEVWAHRDEPVSVAGRGALRGPELARVLGIDAELPPLLVAAIPSAAYDVDAYALRPVLPTRGLSEGDVVDLGDRQLVVLHLPGHTPGSIVLHDRAAGALFSGDVVYDDELLDELPESDVADYVRTMERLLALDVDVVHPGHGPSFDGRRLHEIARAYVARRG